MGYASQEEQKPEQRKTGERLLCIESTSRFPLEEITIRSKCTGPWGTRTAKHNTHEISFEFEGTALCSKLVRRLSFTLDLLYHNHHQRVLSRASETEGSDAMVEIMFRSPRKLAPGESNCRSGEPPIRLVTHTFHGASSSSNASFLSKGTSIHRSIVSAAVKRSFFPSQTIL